MRSSSSRADAGSSVLTFSILPCGGAIWWWGGAASGGRMVHTPKYRSQVPLFVLVLSPVGTRESTGECHLSLPAAVLRTPACASSSLVRLRMCPLMS